MGRFLPRPLPRLNSSDSDQFSSVVRSTSSNSSLSSQSSLPSIPSLTPPLFDHSIETGAFNCSATLQGHSSYIFSLALAGNRLYSGASDGELRVWDSNPICPTNSFSNNNILVEGYSAVKSILVSGDKLFSAHHDHKIRVWKIDKSTAQQRYKLAAILPTFSDTCMSLFAAKKYVRIRRHKKRTWIHHVDTVSSLALTADSSLLYSVSWDRTLKIWRTSDYKCIESVQNAHDDAINAVVLSTDGCIYTGSADKKIKVWRKKDGENKHSLLSTLEKHKSAVNALALSADGAVLYSGTCDRSIIVWKKDGDVNAANGHMLVIGALRGHTKAILCLATVSDLVCSGSADRTVRVWRKSESGSYSCLAVLEGHKSPVKCLTAAAVDGDGKDLGDSDGSGNDIYQVYSGGLDFEIRVWQILGHSNIIS